MNIHLYVCQFVCVSLITMSSHGPKGLHSSDAHQIRAEEEEGLNVNSALNWFK